MRLTLLDAKGVGYNSAIVQGQGIVFFLGSLGLYWLVKTKYTLFNNLIWHGEIRDCNKPERITPLKTNNAKAMLTLEVYMVGFRGLKLHV